MPPPTDLATTATIPSIQACTRRLSGQRARRLRREMLAGGKVDVAFNCSGGLHHAMPGRASGFCIFNDPGDRHQPSAGARLRVAYVDIDAHHGDGVQSAFYDSDRVLTVSMHESGSYLFPGTGFVEEMGRARDTATPSTFRYFPTLATRPTSGPCVRRSSAGGGVWAGRSGNAAGHGPLLRRPHHALGLTVQGHARMAEELGRLCRRWLAFGGGGYDVSAVARGWTLDFGVMLDTEWPGRDTRGLP